MQLVWEKLKGTALLSVPLHIPPTAGTYRVLFKRSGAGSNSIRVLSKPDFQQAH